MMRKMYILAKGPAFEIIPVDARKWKAAEARRGMIDADDQIAALVEVGAIPYRERYEGRHHG